MEFSIECGDVTETAKRLGEDCFFFGAFVVFRHISAIFLHVLFGGKENFIKFATRKDVAPISDSEYIKINKLKNTQRIET